MFLFWVPKYSEYYIVFLICHLNCYVIPFVCCYSLCFKIYLLLIWILLFHFFFILCNIFFHLLTFNLCVCLDPKRVSCRIFVDGLWAFQPIQPCCSFSWSKKTIIDRSVLIAILKIIFWLILCSFLFIFSFRDFHCCLIFP